MSKKPFISQIIFLIKKVPAFPFLIILFLISLLNKFPKGYIYSYSDFHQISNFKATLHWFSNTLVDWGEGYINYLYVPFYYSILGFIQDFVGQQYMSVAYCFVFLVGSFTSFYAATIFYRADKENLNTNLILVFSLLYAINPYTVLRFSLPSNYFLPYIFIPILFATVYAYFAESAVLSKNLLWCSVAMFLSTICWAGPPFFVAYCILTFVYILLLFITHRKYSLVIFVRKFIIFCFVLINSFAIYFLTWPSILLKYNSEIQAGKYQVSMIEWMYSQSLTILDVLLFRNRHFGLVNINEINFKFFIILTFLLFILSLSRLLFIKKNSQKNTLTLFCFMIVCIIFLLNKGKGFPWETSMHSLFAANIILCSLRSFDKILIFLPFMLIMPYCLFNANIKHKIVPVILLVLTLVISYHFVNGDLYKKYYGVDKGKDYQSSRFSALVKIPQEYFDIVSETNRLKSDFRVFSVPWSLENPDLKGWIISPKWKNSGANPVIQYFSHSYVQMNAPNVFRGWNYGIDWSEQNNDESLWLLPLSGMLNAKYLIFQKDVQLEFVDQTISKINFYKSKGFIKLLATNPYFDFFEINDIYFLPHFYVPDDRCIVEQPSSIPVALKKLPLNSKPVILELGNFNDNNMSLNDDRVVIEYKKINSTKYKVKFHGITKSFSVVFSETFFSFWKIYPELYKENKNCDIETYKIFEDNEAYQATKEELKTYLTNGWISELGDGSLKKNKVNLWTSFNSSQSYEEKYHIDFVSKKMKEVVQNNNIANGNFYDTLFLEAIDENYHRIANGYANYWQIDLEYLKHEFPEKLKENPDGSYDLEVIVEFESQKILNIARVSSSIFGCIILVLLILTYRFKKESS